MMTGTINLRRRPVVGAFVLAIGLIGGCASYQLAPLTVTHPAHPDAPPAPAPPRSQTLAYTAADLPSAQPVAAVAPPSPGAQPSAPAPSASSRVVGEGEVVKTVPSSSQIVVDHGEIKGFMEPMTMGYWVDPASLLAGLKEGDQIRFTIDVQRRAIVAIEKLR